MSTNKIVKQTFAIRSEASEKMNNYLHEILGDKYALQTVCLRILKDLDQCPVLTNEQQEWYNDLVDVVYHQGYV